MLDNLHRNAFMLKVMQPPTLDTLADIAERHGFDLSPDDLATYAALIAAAQPLYARLDELDAPKPESAYPREAGYRPSPAENPLGAWYWRCSIDGAEGGLLAGRTIAVKDSIAVGGMPMMNGSALLEGFVSETDATVVSRILDAGGHIAGKSVCEHLCVSDTSITSDTGPVLNPHDASRSAGGSSSGSSVLVATGAVDMALGTDQAGSIRMPAAWCGVYGLKPTYGLVPYTGCSSIEYTLDHVGPIAATVRDTALLLQAIAGPDGLDPRQGAAHPTDYLASLEDGIEGLRVGVLEEGFGWPGAEEAVEATVRDAADALRGLGARVESVSIPLHTDSAAIWRGIGVEGNMLRQPRGSLMATGAAGYYDVRLFDALARSRADRAGELAYTAKLIALAGTYLHERYGGRYYAKARNLVPALVRAYDGALARYDVLVMPTTPMRAPRLPAADASLEQLIHHAFSANASICGFDVSGHPAITIPVGSTDDLPIGFMAVAARSADATLLRLARTCEQTIARPLK
jgi:amidase